MIPPVAVVCGGLGTRLGPATAHLPKSLVPVAGEPFLFHQLRLLASRGARRVVLCAGHRGEAILEAAGDGSAFGLEVTGSLDGPTLLGTAGAVRQALPLLGPSFCVVYGDSYLACDWEAAVRAFELSGRLALMTVFHNRGRFVQSNVELDGGRIVAYDKSRRTPRMEHVDHGLGLFRAQAFASVAPGVPSDLADLYQRLLAEGQLAAHEVPERFHEAGSPEGLADLERYLVAREEAP